MALTESQSEEPILSACSQRVKLSRLWRAAGRSNRNELIATQVVDSDLFASRSTANATDDRASPQPSPERPSPLWSLRRSGTTDTQKVVDPDV